MIKRPLTGMAVFLLGGICMYQIPRMLLFMLAAVLLGVTAAMEYPKINTKLKLTKEDRHRYLWPVFLIAGYVIMNKANEPVPITQLLNEKDTIVMTGYVSDIRNTEKSVKILLTEVTINQQYTEKKVIAFINNRQLQRDTKEVQTDQYLIGNQVLVKGTLHIPRQATNDGQFDEAAYYQAMNIHLIVYAKQVDLMEPSVFWLQNSIYQLRKQLTDRMYELLPDEKAGLLCAVLLGEKELLTEELKQLYQENGFAHIMAVSGLHISLIGYGLYLFCKKLTLPLILRCTLPSVLLLLYGALVGYSVSACRSILMFLLTMAAILVGRSYDGLSAVSLSAILILLKNPLCLYTPGFLLSYAAVLGILLIYPVLMNRREGAKPSKMLSAVMFSLSIQLALLPLQCYFYYEVSSYSLIPNLILLPLCSFLVSNTAAACAVSFLSGALGRFLIASSYYLLSFFELVLRLLIRLPYHTIVTGCPPPEQIIAYYVLLVSCLLLQERCKQWYWKLGLVALVPLLFHYKEDNLRVTALDVGQGDCLVIEQKEHVYIVDGGSTDVSNVYKYRIAPYLKYHRITSADAVVVTHSDTDHICGIEDMIQESFDIAILYVPKLKQNTQRLQDLILSAKCQAIGVTSLSEGDTFGSETILFRCLNPGSYAEGKDTNQDSVVLWLQYGQFDLLLMADTTKTVEERLIQSYKEEFVNHSIEGIKAGHHGSDYGTQTAWLGVTKPEFVILSYGRNNSYGHPGIQLLQRLKENQIIALHTAKSGAIQLISDGRHWISAKAN